MIRGIMGWRPFDSERNADPRREPHPGAQD